MIIAWPEILLRTFEQFKDMFGESACFSYYERKSLGFWYMKKNNESMHESCCLQTVDKHIFQPT
jgi:hypothetical protein